MHHSFVSTTPTPWKGGDFTFRMLEYWRKCPTQGVRHPLKCLQPKRFSCQSWRVLTERVLAEYLHKVALTELPPGTCKCPHPRQLWGFKPDVKSQGMGCKLAIFSPLMPYKILTRGGWWFGWLHWLPLTCNQLSDIIIRIYNIIHWLSYL